MMFRKNKNGQSTLEYALLLAAVLLAVIYGANTIIKNKAKANMDAAGVALDKAKTELEQSIGGSSSGGTGGGS